MNNLNCRNLVGLTWYTHGNQKRNVIRSHNAKCCRGTGRARKWGEQFGQQTQFRFQDIWQQRRKAQSPARGRLQDEFPQGLRSRLAQLMWYALSWMSFLPRDTGFFFFFLNSGQEAGSEKIHNPGFPELTLENRNRERFFAQTPPVGPLVSVQGHGNAFPIVLKCTVIIRAFSHWGKDSPHHDSPSLVCSTYLFIWGAEHSNLCFPLLTA